jgi:hypothetical protein
MARYKVLKSVAHNVGHRYLSLMNWRAGNYVVEHLYRAAREANEPRVIINVLCESIEPEAVRTAVLLESVAHARAWLGQLVQSQGAALDMISALTIAVDFRFWDTRPSPDVPDLDLIAYTCNVEIVDDRGRSHTAAVPEWWRY